MSKLLKSLDIAINELGRSGLVKEANVVHNVFMRVAAEPGFLNHGITMGPEPAPGLSPGGRDIGDYKSYDNETASMKESLEMACKQISDELQQRDMIGKDEEEWNPGDGEAWSKMTNMLSRELDIHKRDFDNLPNVDELMFALENGEPYDQALDDRTQNAAHMGY